MTGRLAAEGGDTAMVISPCINVCRIEDGLCAGCFRSLDEIRAWSGATSAERRAIWLRLLQRAEVAPPAVLQETSAP